ncbi:phosphate ABC transporter permease PstA [Candidatus Gracilibacteria bacterium]|nr:phosphate ABC transporter permease PstA [Candidatus Gracilibacteria bacterium]
MTTYDNQRSVGQLPEGEDVKKNLNQRKRIGSIWRSLFLFCIIFGLAALGTLLVKVVNDSVGLIAVDFRIDPEEVTGGVEIEAMPREQLLQIIDDNLSNRIRARLEREQPIAERSDEQLIEIINEDVFQTRVIGSWSLFESLFGRPGIEERVFENNPNAELSWYNWLNWDFLTTPMSSTPFFAGVRTAILGSLWVLMVTIVVAFPIGIAGAIYLEEYSRSDNWLSRTIQTNIYNLSGVPSIIYGMLGLAIFVRALEPITSGSAFGFSDPTTSNGRTILSAGLTMALLVLPVIIIASQEAIRAVPSSLRQASYGLGATKWQTVWNIVLPQAFPGILTGVILAMSRAVGETAPLIIVGASTFIVTDPTNIFSKFTVMPIQIYTWTSRPEVEFQRVAAAAIVVLLVLMLLLNATAILLRNYLRGRRVSN